MTAAKLRTGGAWVDSSLEGKARIGGAWVDFGPAGGGGFGPDQNIFGLTAAGGAFEEGTAISVGTKFRVTAAGRAVAPRYYCPGTPPTSAKMGIYRVSDQVQLAVTSITMDSPNTWERGPDFSVMPDLAVSTDYMWVYWTSNRYSATGSFSWPVTSGDLVTANPAGFFLTTADIAFPTNSSAAVNFFADGIFQKAL